MAFELENIAILNVKGFNYRYAIRNMARNDTINMLSNYEYEPWYKQNTC